ncbi:uncharacterized protein LOC122518664 [Polistes fuscatus]|uniref:uncharacterized protein LOC122518664 n=1 Tax=Polistes fuscatus TaxID=30207 RepID=UPI001CA86190|nr:uncharacterized protein LOC122518664 [Polistes fuscatus]
MYNVTYILIGIVLICLFPLEINSGIYDDKIILKDNLQNIGKKQSNDINTVKVSKLDYVLRNATNKCGLENSCKNNDTNLRKNVDNGNNKKLITNLVPPLITSKDYYTYFNRRKKELKHKNEQGNKNQYNVKNHKFVKPNISDPTIESDQLSYIRDHAPTNVTKETSQNQIGYNKNDKKKSTTNVSQISPDGDRVEFQIRGHEGPKTYIFGFDTGIGKNRQYRLEERFNDGTVKGHYGYYDARGKLRTVKYIAKPIEGYQEKHHETIIQGS